MLVDRGGCYFINKTRNVQKLGGAAVIVANDEYVDDISLFCMISDGDDSDVHIPSLYISEDDGTLLKNTITSAFKDSLNNPVKSYLTALIEFNIKRQQIVEMELWYSSGDKSTLTFINEINEFIVLLNQNIKFTPHINVNKEEGSNSVSIFKDVALEVTRDVSLKQSLQEYCVFYAEGGTVNGTRKWFSYMSNTFQCLPVSYADECTLKAMTNAYVSVAEVQSCQQQYKTIYDLEANLHATKKIRFNPNIVINSQEYRGSIKADYVKNAICSAFDRKPFDCIDPCPAGTALRESDMQCINCGPGEYSSIAENKCMKCSPGTFSNSVKNSVCAQCNPDEVSLDYGSTGCTKCPEGMVAISKAKCVRQCHPGEYISSVAINECAICKPGTFSNSWQSLQCTLCKPGEYNANEGSVKCIQAPIGTFIAGYGQTKFEACPRGFFSEIKGATGCIQCAANTFSLEGYDKCIICQMTGDSREITVNRKPFFIPSRHECYWTCPSGYEEDLRKMECIELKDYTTIIIACSIVGSVVIFGIIAFLLWKFCKCNCKGDEPTSISNKCDNEKLEKANTKKMDPADIKNVELMIIEVSPSMRKAQIQGEIVQIKTHIVNIEYKLNHELICPISQRTLEDPVIAEDEQVYEREYILREFESGRNVSPLTKQPMGQILRANRLVRHMVEELRKERDDLNNKLNQLKQDLNKA